MTENYPEDDKEAGFTLKLPQEKPKVALALGGGVARGWAHIGAIRALKRHGIEPDIVVGTSVGALVGGAYLANRLDELEEWARSLTRTKIISYLDFKVKQGGLIGGRRLMAELRTHFKDIRIENLDRPFVAVATDLTSGHEVWIKSGRLADALRTSFSLPGIFPPVKAPPYWLVDGALVNPVPVSVAHALGAHVVIAVNLSADIIGRSMRPGFNVPVAAGFDLMPFVEKNRSIFDFLSFDSLIKRIFRRDDHSPSVFGAMISSLQITLDRITRSRLAGEPPDVHIAPRVGHIGLVEFDRADELIAEGEAAVERVIPDIKAALAIHNIPVMDLEFDHQNR